MDGELCAYLVLKESEEPERGTGNSACTYIINALAKSLFAAHRDRVSSGTFTIPIPSYAFG
jgi:hypothetical protein